jgi:hypothetical protein
MNSDGLWQEAEGGLLQVTPVQGSALQAPFEQPEAQAMLVAV